MWSVRSAVALGLAGAFSGFVVLRFIISSRIMQKAIVRPLTPPVMPFHMHLMLRHKAADADDSVICGITRCFGFHQILDQGLAVRGLQFSQAIRVLGFQCTKNLTVIADLIAAKGVHGSIPSDMRQEQGGGCALAARFRGLGQPLFGQTKNDCGHLLHSTRKVETHSGRGKAMTPCAADGH